MTALKRIERMEALLSFLQCNIAAGADTGSLMRLLVTEVESLKLALPPSPPYEPITFDHTPRPAA